MSRTTRLGALGATLVALGLAVFGAGFFLTRVELHDVSVCSVPPDGTSTAHSPTPPASSPSEEQHGWCVACA